MKANKALKRLTKIESLLSDVAKRFSAHTPDMRGAFDDLKTAFGKVKEAVGIQASARTTKKKAAPAKTAKTREKEKPGPMKTAAKKATAAKSGKKPAPVTRAAKRTAPKKAAVASAGHESMAAPVEAE